jgi:hypothetical protein
MTSCAALAIACAAHAVHGHGGYIDRYAAMDGGLPGRVHLVARLDHVPHDDRVHLVGRQFRALQGRAHDGRTEIDRRHVLECASVRADCRADG